MTQTHNTNLSGIREPKPQGKPRISRKAALILAGASVTIVGGSLYYVLGSRPSSAVPDVQQQRAQFQVSVKNMAAAEKAAKQQRANQARR